MVASGPVTAGAGDVLAGKGRVEGFKDGGSIEYEGGGTSLAHRDGVGDLVGGGSVLPHTGGCVGAIVGGVGDLAGSALTGLACWSPFCAAALVSTIFCHVLSSRLIRRERPLSVVFLRMSLMYLPNPVTCMVGKHLLV